MKLWTIQPFEVYEQILKTGIYRCDITKSGFKYWIPQYDWLVSQMEKRIGRRPEGVEYPVWAWYKIEGHSGKPDLRKERFANGTYGEKFVRLEIEIPDDMVVLTDFDLWSLILCDTLISYSEEELNKIQAQYNNIKNKNRQREFKNNNWLEVFNLGEFKNSWITRGYTIQATFWELKKEQIKQVTSFKSYCSKN